MRNTVSRCSLLLLIAFVSVAEAQEERGSIERSTHHIGARRFRAGEWGVAGVRLVNPEDQDVTLLTGVYFDGDVMTRYSRRVAVPARTIRNTWLPVRVVVEKKNDPLQWHAFLYRLASDGTPEMLRAADQYVVDTEPLPPAHDPFSLVIDDWQNSSEMRSIDRELMVVMRLAAGNSRALANMDAASVPAFPRSLDAVDHIMLAGNRIAETPMGLAALRTWVQRGGRLWIRLDRVDLSTVERLLGDSTQITEVDRTGLTEFQLWDELRQVTSGDVRHFDYPVEVVRVIAEDVKKIHSVDGWPVSFVKSVGEGRILFTTMSAEGWIRQRRADEQARIPDHNSHYIATQPLQDLTGILMSSRDAAPLTSQDFEPYLTSTIGYRISDRSPVLTILGLFCLSFIGAGMWFHRASRRRHAVSVPDTSTASFRRPEWLVIVGAVLACAASIPLIFLGQRVRKAVPATASMAEFVRTEPGTSAVHTVGAAAICSPEGQSSDLKIGGFHLVLPRRGAVDGEVRQLLQTDLDEWRWEDLKMWSGLQFLDTSQSRQLTSPVRAIATIGPNGVTGRIESEAWTEPTDAIIATTAEQVLAVNMQPDGQFAATSGDQLDHGVFVQGNLLTDQQLRRGDVLKRLLEPGSVSRYPSRPTLLAWTKPREQDIDFPDNLERTSVSLLAVPLEFQSPAPGTDVVIPAPLLTFENLPLGEGQRSTAFNSRTREWISTSYKTEILLRFQVPDSVFPLDVQQARLEFRLAAPARTLSVESGLADALVPLRTIEEPSGTYSITLDQPEMLALDGLGGLHIKLAVTELGEGSDEVIGRSGLDRSWKMEFVRLEMSGRTLDRKQNNPGVNQ